MFDQVLAILSSVEGQVGFIALAIDMLLRLVKSPKPLSIAHGVAAGFKGIALVAAKLAALLDRVLPQKTAEAPKA